MATFEHIHRFLDDRSKNYLDRPGLQTLRPAIREELLAANKASLFACNAEARIDFAHIATEAMWDFGVGKLGPHHFITYCPVDGVLPIEEASSFDTSIIIQRLRQALPGVPFIGMVEAALYKEWGPDGPHHGHDYVDWHAHLIPWRTEQREIALALEALGSRVPNMYDRAAVYVRKLELWDLQRTLLYMLKGQVKEYRVHQSREDTVDGVTGEVRHCTRQRKRWMRTGDRVRMCRVMEDRRLTDLLFGNSDGTRLVRAIRFQAMQGFCRWAEQENRRREARGGEPQYPQVERNRRLGQQLAREEPTTRTLFPGYRL